MKCRTFIVTLLVSVLGLVTQGNCQEKSTEEEIKGKIQKEQVESESVKSITEIPTEMDSTGFVGIYITETENGEGTKVDDLVPDGSAAKAGIKKGDIIIELDGKKITDEEFGPKEIAKTKLYRKLISKSNGKEKPFKLL